MDYLNLSATQILKERFKGAKEELKEAGFNLNGFREHVLTVEPQYDSGKGWSVISNVWRGRSADVRLTELAQELTNTQKAK